jgi:hypothetical protein
MCVPERGCQTHHPGGDLVILEAGNGVRQRYGFGSELRLLDVVKCFNMSRPELVRKEVNVLDPPIIPRELRCIRCSGAAIACRGAQKAQPDDQSGRTMSS